MKIISNILLLILFIYISNQNEKESDSVIEEDDYKKNGNGYKCRDKLDEYRKKFSSIKSFVLTDKNFRDYLNKNKLTLIYIHSACNKESNDLIPVIKYISEIYEKRADPDSPKIATLEITDDENNWNNQYNFRSAFYPIIILKERGTRGYTTYDGYYKAHSIITFITKYENNEIITMNNTKILEQLLTPKFTYMSIVCFNNKYNKIFKKFSHGLSFVLFGNCTNQKLCEEKFGKNIYKYSDFALVKMTHIDSDFEESPDNKLILEDNRKPEIIPYNYSNYQKLKEFIYINAMPKVFNFTGFNKNLLEASLVNSIIYVKGSQEKKSNKEISQILRKAMNLEQNKIVISGILGPTTNENEITLMDDFRLELEDYSVYGNVIIQTFNDLEKILYRMDFNQLVKDKGITEESLLNFVKDFNKGKLTPELKSENRPKYHPKENLRMVVARTFDEEITYNNDVAIVLCLLTMNLTNLKEHEKIIDILTDKLDALNTTLIFGFLDVGLNYMKDVPKYNSKEKPYYRYYYKNKSEGYDDFKGNYNKIEEIEEWIAANYGKENGPGYDDLLRKYIQEVNEQMRAEEEAKLRKEAEFERDVEAGNITSFEMIMGDGSSEAINITEQKIQRILKKKMEAEMRKQKENELKNKSIENDTKINEQMNSKETDL